MCCEERLRKILEEEYGIKTLKQLDSALAAAPKIDISILVKKQERSNVKCQKSRKNA